jgi:hypothetical protein
VSTSHRPDRDPASPRGSLRQAIGKYLPDLVFGACDGVITTLAVVSGVVGASLSTTIILILGFANLLADGFSMGASNVLSRRSDASNKVLPTLADASGHGVATFIGFVAAGIVPLSAYLLPWFGARGLRAPWRSLWERCLRWGPAARSSRSAAGSPPGWRCCRSARSPPQWPTASAS